MASAMFPPPNSNTPIPTFIIKDNAQCLDVSENKDVIFPIKVHRTLEFYSFGEQWPPGLSSPASQAPMSSQAPVLKGLNFFFFTPSSPRQPTHIHAIGQIPPLASLVFAGIFVSIWGQAGDMLVPCFWSVCLSGLKEAWEILLPWPRAPPAVEAQSLHHRTTREAWAFTSEAMASLLSRVSKSLLLD